MENLTISVGGCYSMEPISFKFNRGLLPLTIPIKINQTSGQMTSGPSHIQLPAQGHIQVQGQRRAIILNMSKTTV